MKCPFCGKLDSEVLESRIVEEGDGIRRRRLCHICNKRFSTIERIKEMHLWVVKKDGRREQFNREKIRKGIQRAVEKRPVPLGEVEEIARRVESDILKKNLNEVPSNLIGRTILKYLRKTDKVAWIRFASVYFEFEDLTDFEKIIKKQTNG